MKSKLLFFLVVLTMLLPARGSADDFAYTYEGQTVNYTVLDEEAKTCETKSGIVFAVNEVSGNLILPAHPKKGDIEYTLTTIGEGSFCYSEELVSVTLPNTITTIGNSAFEFCPELISILIPNSVTSIGTSAFSYCSGLTSITIPNNITSIGNYAFDDCDNLKELYFNAENCIDGGSGGSSIFPSSVEKITIGENVKKLPDYIFLNCTSLRDIYFNAESCSDLTDTSKVFPSTKNVYFGENVKHIPGYLLYGFKNLTSIEIPTSVISIGRSAFRDCTGLTAVEIPNSVTSIGTDAFNGCRNLSTLSIPASISEISSYAFKGCSNIETVEYLSENPCTAPKNIFDNVIYEDATLIYPEEYGLKFKKTEPWCYFKTLNVTLPAGEDFTYAYGSDIVVYTVLDAEAKTCEAKKVVSLSSNYLILPSNPEEGDTEYTLVSIAPYAFSNCDNITRLSIPNTVVKIGEYAFYECSNITAISNSWESVKEIGKFAFYGCNALTEVIIPNSIVSIGSNAFGGCPEIKTIRYDSTNPCEAEKNIFDDTVYENATLIYPGGCSAIFASTQPWENFKIENAPLSTGDEFRYYYEGHVVNYIVLDEEAKTCATSPINGVSDTLILPANPKSGTMEYTLVSIGKNSFSGYCSELTSVIIPNTVKYIEDRAFSTCSKLKNLTIPESVIEIGANAFYMCSDLSEITLPNTITQIGNGAFYGCSITELTIPESVTYIGNGAFSSCDNLKTLYFKAEDCTDFTGYSFPNTIESVIIGDGVRRIPAMSFWGIESLTALEIPNSVTTIGRLAFKGCTSLKELEIPDLVTSIGDQAFAGCTSLEKLELSNSLTTIGEEAFYGCLPLRLTEIPSSVTTIGNWAFYNCNGTKELYFNAENCEDFCYRNYIFPNSIEKVVFGDNVKHIPTYIFNECKEIVSVKLPAMINEISTGAFFDCHSLSEITIPNSVTSIGENAFLCSGLTSLTLPNALTTIEAGSFSGCRNLKKVEIPNSVTTICDQAFYNSALTEISIPNSVNTIGQRAFSGCNDMTEVYFDAENCADFTYDSKVFPTSVEKVIIGENVKRLPDYIFNNCSSLTDICFNADSCADLTYNNYVFSSTGIKTNVKNIIFGEKVRHIPGALLNGFAGLTSVKIPASVTSIGAFAFYNCTGLTRVDFASIESLCKIKFSWMVGDNPLYYAHHLYIDDEEIFDVVIPESITSIRDYTFAGASALRSVSIHDSVTSIGELSFTDCSGLTSIEIPNSVTSIGLQAFFQCSGLNSIRIPDSVTSLGRYVFANSGLTEATIGSSLTSIPASTFEDCYNLHTVNILGPVTAIESSAFKNCEQLSSINLPATTKVIDQLAFAGCTKLRKITIPESVTDINYCAFLSCSGLSEITIPKSVTTLGMGAFYYTGITTVHFNAENCNDLDVENLVFPTEVDNIIIGENVKSLPANAFNSCPAVKNLYFNAEDCADVNQIGYFPATIENLSIGETVRNIPAYAFSNLKNLTSVRIPESVKSIGHYTFGYCTGMQKAEFASLESLCNIQFSGLYSNPLYYAHNLYINSEEVTEVEIPESVTKIGSVNFAGCNMTSVKIPDSVTEILLNAFYACRGLTSITIPESVTKIDFGAFQHCTALNDVKLPESLTTLGYVVFLGCSEIKTVEYLTEEPIEGSIGIFDTEVYENAALIIPKGSMSAFQSTAPWCNFKNISEKIVTGMQNVVYSSSDINYNEPYEVYNLNGLKIADSLDNLVKGYYIVCQGPIIAKIAVK